MYKIINGKRYNTETATEIAHAGNNLGYSDFSHYEETLYRTSKGNWFLVGEGGALSKYAKPIAGGGWRGDSDAFRVLSETEAYDWLEKHEETEAIEKYFADSVEDA